MQVAKRLRSWASSENGLQMNALPSVWEGFSYGTADFYQREHFIMVAVFCEKHSHWSGESEDARYHPKK